MTTAVVVGGGFYGASIAIYLKQKRGMERVILLERGPKLLGRSSFVNQARVHRGYHYLRSFTTAHRSIVNAPRFEADFGPAIFSGFTNLYAIARRNSKVTVKQTERFCREVGIALEPASKHLSALFNPTLIERAYLAEENSFDADKLRGIMLQRLNAAGVELRLEHDVVGCRQDSDGVRCEIRSPDGASQIGGDIVFNCTYSRLQTTLGGNEAGMFGLKHEISEMILITPPPELAQLGVTVMDGAFFSTMPFPARGLHTLSHVRYTPHASWIEDGSTDPYAVLGAYHRESRADRMIRDAARYLPMLQRARAETSLFEVKTVLTRNEGDDGRPILFRRHEPHGRLFSVLGGKIDNIYDILEQLDEEQLPTSGEPAWTA